MRERAREESAVRLTFLGVYYPEWLVGALGVLCYVLYRHFQLGLRAPLALYFERVKGTIPCYLIALLLMFFILRLLHIREAQRIRRREDPTFQFPIARTAEVFRQSFLTGRLILRDLRFLNVICVMFVIFVNMKHLIPYIHPGHFDGVVGMLEERVFGAGGVGAVVMRAIGAEWASPLAAVYTFFYPFVAILIYLFIIQRNEILTVEFLTAFILLWFVGLFLVYAAPTRGPFYSAPKIYEKLPYAEVTSMQQKLLKHDAALKENPKHPNAVFLISAVPSLHFAVAILGALYLRRVHFLLAMFGWIFTALTAVTTLYFGWHFLLCDLVALLLAIAMYRVSFRIYRRPLRYYPVSYVLR